VTPQDVLVASVPTDDERALDALGAVLRALGDDAFEIDDTPVATIRDKFHRWARHLLVGALHPERAVPTEGRDFPGLRRFVQGQRRAERRFVQAAVGGMRQAIWAIVQTVSRAIPEETREDEVAQKELLHLRNALESGSPERLREAALRAVATLDSLLSRRRERHLIQIDELRGRVEHLGEKLVEAQREGATDPLTRIPNRRAFELQLARFAAVGELMGRPPCLLLADVDHFKEINDGFGHAAGDLALRALADTLVRCFPRRSDCVARYGGDEMAVLLGDAGIADALRLADRLLDAVRRMAPRYEETVLRMTVSIGLAELADGETPEAWLARADSALYRAKSAGRDRAVAG
jgi:diguanylate cyclase (GGDEF)-like protein